MSTPRSKPVTRWRVKGRPGDDNPLPMGKYANGLTNTEFQSALGDFASLWPHVEDAMIYVFAEILGIQRIGSATIAFRSIINQQTRIDVMTTLLEKSPTHTSFDEWYDDTMSEFKSLNKLRNKYIHSAWWTHQSGKVLIQEDLATHRVMGDPREIRLSELKSAVRRLEALLCRIDERMCGDDQDSKP